MGLVGARAIVLNMPELQCERQCMTHYRAYMKDWYEIRRKGTEHIYARGLEACRDIVEVESLEAR